MKDELELKILPDGRIASMYSDELLSLAEKEDEVYVRRASDVAWDNHARGWTVTCYAHSRMALRTIDGKVVAAKRGPLAIFKTREEAISAERSLFWELVEV